MFKFVRRAGDFRLAFVKVDIIYCIDDHVDSSYVTGLGFVSDPIVTAVVASEK